RLNSSSAFLGSARLLTAALHRAMLLPIVVSELKNRRIIRLLEGRSMGFDVVHQLSVERVGVSAKLLCRAVEAPPKSLVVCILGAVQGVIPRDAVGRYYAVGK